MRLQHLLILIGGMHFHVRQKPPALGDFAKEPSAGGLIFLVFLQMLGEFCNFFGKDRNLYLRGTSVFVVCTELRDDLLFDRAFEWHRLIGNAIKNFAPGPLEHMCWQGAGTDVNCTRGLIFCKWIGNLISKKSKKGKKGCTRNHFFLFFPFLLFLPIGTNINTQQAHCNFEWTPVHPMLP